jgi:hypothetical protein
VTKKLNKVKAAQAIELLSSLSDAELEAGLLSSWQQLTGVLSHRLPRELIERLLILELRHGQAARVAVLVRLRQALARAASREGEVALTTIVDALARGACPDEYDLVAIGLPLGTVERFTEEFAATRAALGAES